MTERVLGFHKKDAHITYVVWKTPRYMSYLVKDSELVPVRLKKESVSLAWLEKEINKVVDEWTYDNLDWSKRLLSAAKKEAEK